MTRILRGFRGFVGVVRGEGWCSVADVPWKRRVMDFGTSQGETRSDTSGSARSCNAGLREKTRPTAARLRRHYTRQVPRCARADAVAWGPCLAVIIAVRYRRCEASTVIGRANLALRDGRLPGQTGRRGRNAAVGPSIRCRARRSDALSARFPGSIRRWTLMPTACDLHHGADGYVPALLGQIASCARPAALAARTAAETVVRPT